MNANSKTTATQIETNFTNFVIGLLIGLLLGTVLLAHEYKVQVKELKAQITVGQVK